ncbi:hypothetical protein GMI69_05670 [Eggerthellaceae bacterium zg-887]|uniref:hypothetical protein n=1 Tax=Xiamenia xianingshaonis TaxID=2682776 RepID=UPI00140982E4|nr:hypothetical protein [Xiamenia xianingshaonis]NHM16149.1 hypothetical protein [Xiamenia xianingshaonis]
MTPPNSRRNLDEAIKRLAASQGEAPLRVRDVLANTAVGVDGSSRLLELVYAYDEEEDAFLVYHGMTPPSRKTLQELGLER